MKTIFPIILLIVIPNYLIAGIRAGEFESLNLPCSQVEVAKKTQEVAIEKFPKNEKGLKKPISISFDIEQENLPSSKETLLIVNMVHLRKEIRKLDDGMTEFYREMVKVAFNNKCEVMSVENVSETRNIIVN